MSAIRPAHAGSFVRPRPGVIKALGVANIVLASLGTMLLFSTMVWTFLALSRQQTTKVSVVTVVTTNPAQPKAANRTMMVDPFVGMDDPNVIRFNVVDVVTGLILNGLMFATGIGLINLKRWGVGWWSVLAWVKIVRVWLFWGFFVVVVSPAISTAMGKAALAMTPNSPAMIRGMPALEFFTFVYSIMWMIVAAFVVFLGTFYPALSLWLLSRPGVQAAVAEPPPSPEPQLS